VSKVRVLVAEDSLTVRKYLVECLSARPDVEVVAEAEDGKQAIELCERLRPDVVTLDMMMPVMTGLATTEYIMAYCPTPIVIVSASTNRGELFRTYEALAAGALDVIEKPLDGGTPEWERHFVLTVKLVSRVKVITHPRGRLYRTHVVNEPSRVSVRTRTPGPQYRCVCLGISTGGPQALARLPARCPRTSRYRF
jgi:two-component system chemotaxis response regulator CheB